MILNHVAHPLFTICVLALPITPLRCWPADSVEEEKEKKNVTKYGGRECKYIFFNFFFVFIYIYIFLFFIYFIMNKSDKNNFGQNKT